MSTATKTKTKRVRAPKPKKSDVEASLGMDGAEAEGPHEEPLPTLPKRPAKEVQETFRCTRDEHRKLVMDASEGGYESMGAYYRAKLGLS